jgi:hemerythrin-like metal-binding protein
MDATHRESLELLERVRSSGGDAFMPLFLELIEHTQAHFAAEEAMMRERRFHGTSEHCDEHGKLLDEMRYFYEKAKKIPAFGRSYIDDYAYDRFRRHIINIDAQLAMFLNGQGR